MSPLISVENTTSIVIAASKKDFINIESYSLNLMEISPPELSYLDDKVVVSARFTCKGEENTLWFKFDKEFADYAVLEKSDAFLVALLPLAMQLHEDIRLHHPVSEEIYYNVTEYLIPLISLAMPEKGRVRVVHSGFSDITRKGTDGVVATGLSCGVDSFFTLYEHARPDIPPSHRITHCVFMDVGSHGVLGSEGEQLRFTRRLDITRRCAAELGMKTVVIESNLSQFISEPYAKTATIRNAGAALVLEKLFRIYYYSSSVSFENIHVKDNDIDHSDPMVLSYLSTNHLRFVSSGVQFKRTEKTEIVSRYEPSYRYLNVCFFTGDNCSVCDKCLRTELTLDLYGKLELYAGVFDLDKYRREKRRYICSLLATSSRNVFSKERCDLMKRVGFRLGPATSCYYLGYKTRYELRFHANAFTKAAMKRRKEILGRFKVSRVYEESSAVKKVVSLMEHPFPWSRET